jgi:hypothetical protein
MACWEEVLEPTKADAAAPNPVVGMRTIGYELPVASQVSIRMYIVQGRAVRTLVDAVMPAGRHDLQFDTDGLAGGVYIYSLRTPKYYETRKIVVIK